MGKSFKVPCDTCDQTGKVCRICEGSREISCNCNDNDDCEICHGTRILDCTACLDCSNCDGLGFIEVYVELCEECGGDGKDSCAICNGTGYNLNDLAEFGIDLSLM
ncbi:hypothetical protein SDC9_15109 [bioreactor metagenome]|uniref:Uncharacterized protein n=1 Tax=bioreactor metagenome TaxID=1076179 RepID=A0A644TRU4_9ZZZZ|nr:hypothetical protein [Negativicutes bacterium]